ncbi:hypothetical protein H5410_012246 [Solanum commersonii]|uniref:Uncharacterized protein n=1 Tax=Solanum commersonii TaxID=4109 RepID=A0A9J6ARN2_SOLCO|nr:hypothetical protein H5410_012246 [Solanum commersonii]
MWNFFSFVLLSSGGKRNIFCTHVITGSMDLYNAENDPFTTVFACACRLKQTLRFRYMFLSYMMTKTDRRLAASRYD